MSLNSSAPYKVKDGRPALLLGNHLYLHGGILYTVGHLSRSPLPLGVQAILTSLLSQPTGSRVGMRAGVASLKSYVRSLESTVIDAGSGSMEGDSFSRARASVIYAPTDGHPRVGDYPAP